MIVLLEFACEFTSVEIIKASKRGRYFIVVILFNAISSDSIAEFYNLFQQPFKEGEKRKASHLCVHHLKSFVRIKTLCQLKNFHYLFEMQGIKVRYHIFFWLGFIILTVAVLSPYYFNLFKAVMHRLAFIPVWLAATYVNLLILMPRFWDKNKKGLFIFLLTLLILTLTIIQRVICIEFIYPKFFWMRSPTAEELNPFWIGPFIQFIIFILLPVLVSMGFRQGWKWFQESVESRQLIAEQKQAELNYLKAQVNPHFLFNTLNSLYGLSLEHSQKVPGMILKLSDLLSYSLYESTTESVSMRREINLVKDFIALESARYGERIDLLFKIEEGSDLEKRIAPLLILPLVENAFKHGVKNSTGAVEILINVKESNDVFKFSIENTIASDISFTSSEKGGLGLINLRKRLELSYPEAFVLEAIKTDKTYKEYALEGFELQVVDYLLKPIPFERFLRAINKYRKHAGEDKSHDGELIRGDQYIYVKSDKKTFKLRMTEIKYIESMNNYIIIHINEIRHVVYKSLTEVLDELSDDFIRIHKSYVVNRMKVSFFTKELVNVQEKELPIGKTYRENISLI